MKTIIYQSFRTENVPGWIAACMKSVRDWATAKGFAYRFWDDRFFDFVPRELYPRASVNKCVLTDYARLIAAKQLLSEGWDRAVWMDADLVVFDSENFNLDLTGGYAFCREVWLDRTVLGRPQFRLTVNNSVSVFCKNETIIDFYLEAAGAILRSDFYSFVRASFPIVAANAEFAPNWHVEAMAFALTRVLKGETKRLIITVPPRSLKSISSDRGSQFKSKRVPMTCTSNGPATKVQFDLLR